MGRLEEHFGMRLENSIRRDKKFLFSLVSCVSVLVIFVNLRVFQSPLIGVVASLVYISINGIFLDHAFFENQHPFFGFILGGLLLVALLGFIGWVILTAGFLDVVGITFVLLIGATVCSLLNKGMKHKNA